MHHYFLVHYRVVTSSSSSSLMIMSSCSSSLLRYQMPYYNFHKIEFPRSCLNIHLVNNPRWVLTVYTQYHNELAVTKRNGWHVLLVVVRKEMWTPCSRVVVGLTSCFCCYLCFWAKISNYLFVFFVIKYDLRRRFYLLFIIFLSNHSFFVLHFVAYIYLSCLFQWTLSLARRKYVCDLITSSKCIKESILHKKGKKGDNGLKNWKLQHF